MLIGKSLRRYSRSHRTLAVENAYNHTVVIASIALGADLKLDKTRKAILERKNRSNNGKYTSKDVKMASLD